MGNSDIPVFSSRFVVKKRLQQYGNYERRCVCPMETS